MTTSERTAKQIDSVGKQIAACYAGISEKALDMRAAPAGMTAREMLEHFGECYVAAIKHMNGEEHSWGTYSVEDKSFKNLWALYEDLRAKAKAACTEGDAENGADTAFGYITSHDTYHVGQLCLIRLADDPNWDAYSIY